MYVFGSEGVLSSPRHLKLPLFGVIQHPMTQLKIWN